MKAKDYSHLRAFWTIISVGFHSKFVGMSVHCFGGSVRESGANRLGPTGESNSRCVISGGWRTADAAGCRAQEGVNANA